MNKLLNWSKSKLMLLGPLNGWLTDYFGSWKIMMIASVASATGALITAFAPSLNIVVLGYGVFIGNLIIHFALGLLAIIIAVRHIKV